MWNRRKPGPTCSGANGLATALALPIVAMTMQQIQSDPALSKRFSNPFPALPEHLASVLDCPGFEEKRWLDRLNDSRAAARETHKYFVYLGKS